MCFATRCSNFAHKRTAIITGESCFGIKSSGSRIDLFCLGVSQNPDFDSVWPKLTIMEVGQHPSIYAKVSFKLQESINHFFNIKNSVASAAKG